MKLDVKDKRVVVAGGSRGIGRSIALAFAEGGAKVSICARGAEALEATRKEIAAAGAVRARRRPATWRARRTSRATSRAPRRRWAASTCW